MRINNRYSIRQYVSLLMMVGDNDVYSKRIGVCYLDHSGNSVVDRDDQVNVHLVKRINRLAVESVSFTLAIRNVIHHICADGFKVGKQQSGRSNTVNIVITVDGNSLEFVNRAAYAADSLIHIDDFQRVNEFGGIIIKTKHVTYLFICAESPGCQQMCGKPVDTETLCNAAGQHFV